MRAVLIGAVESTRIAARCLAQAPGWELVAIVTLPTELADRHSDFVNLTADATAAGCPLIRAANANADLVLDEIRSLDPDFLFVIGWSQLCREPMMAITPGRVVGYHPAALPRLRGRGVIPWTILLDEPITASTLFLIDGGMDTGAILAQRFFHVAPGETAATLYTRHMEMLVAMMPDLLAGLAAGTVVPEAQDDRCATWAARRGPEDGEIDWQDRTDDIWRLVRACGDPYPGAWTVLKGERLIIARSEPIALAEHRAALAGQVVAQRGDGGFVVRCGDGHGLHVSEWRWSRPGPPPLHARLGFWGGQGMTLLARIRRALILAPHPDDEVLGCGGTIARIVAEGGRVEVAIVTRGKPPRFDSEQADTVRAEAEQAHAQLGVSRTHFLDLSAAELDLMAHADLNEVIANVIAEAAPDTLFVPFIGDLHLDHRLVFEAAMVAARPRGDKYPLRILAYETVSETNWSAPGLSPDFHPNVFIDISDFLDAKLRAFACFASQCRPFPDERSIETLGALAMVRGSTITRRAAEAFILVREVS